MKKLNIHEIVDILIGDTSAHGESNRDAISLENLKVKAALVHKLVADLRYTARNRDCYESSVRIIGEEAQKALDCLKNDLNED